MADSEPLVRCRWRGRRPVLVNRPRTMIVQPGDEIWLSAEQADDPHTPADRLDADAYAHRKKAALMELCSERGLPTDGTKAELIARLQADDDHQEA